MPTYQTITVFPGQTVYIPKTAKIVALDATGSAFVDSQCIDLSTAETVACYFIVTTTSKSGDTTPAYNNLTLQGVELGGVKYPFTSPYTFDAGFGDNTMITTLMQALPALSGIVSSICTRTVQYDRGTQNVTWFKTVPSVGTTIALYGTGTRGAADNVVDNFPVIFTAIAKTDIGSVVADFEDNLKCGCGLTTPTT